jgi:hypothetical protein
MDQPIIYGYYLTGLVSHMVKTIPDLVSTVIPLPPNTIYHLDFQGEGLQFYRSRYTKWLPHFQEIGNSQIRFFGRTESNSVTPLVMVSSLTWPPAYEPHSGTGAIIIKAPATFFTQVNINRSRSREELWTPGIAKKTIRMLAINLVRGSTSFYSEYHHVIKLLDIGGGKPHGKNTRNGEGETSPMGAFLWTSYPQWLGEHDSPLSMDMDDARGRMVISMSDGTLAVIEFV